MWPDGDAFRKKYTQYSRLLYWYGTVYSIHTVHTPTQPLVLPMLPDRTFRH